MVRAVLPVLLALFVFTLDVPVALAAAPARGTCALAGRPAWHQVRSEHFLVRTSLDAETARNATVNLERFLAALLPIWGPQFKLEGQLEVLLLRDAELAEFVQGHVRGFLASGDDDSQLIVIALEPTELTGSPLSLPSMTHELAHALIDHALRIGG